MGRIKNNKAASLAVIALIYLLAYAVGAFAARFVHGVVLKWFVFDVAATVITYVFSEILHNSSVYDAYWSLTPMVISTVLFVQQQAFSPWQIAFLAAFNLWSLRLTVNWITVFTDFTYEDWRYRKFRAENTGFMWFVINFFGIHMVPTLVVFAGMLPVFVIVNTPVNGLALPGIALLLCGIALEFFADRDMHEFLSGTTEKITCRRGLWNYSRHPNYLGEMTVWLGAFLTMLPFAPEKWYLGIGFVSVVVLFNVVSVPMMEKRQLSRRPDYVDYKKTTSRILLLPHK